MSVRTSDSKPGRAALTGAGLVGVLNVRKELGWTSHDVVARMRRLSGQRRVGHAGTLDPLAEGVLPVLLGRATRLADLVQQGRKVYEAEVALGVATSTDDREGDITQRAAVPPLAPGEVTPILARFRGEISQVPPAYSAVKVAGQRAYAVARRGGEVALAPRPVTIHALDLLGIASDGLTLRVECSRGTYIRALARDIARALGTVGHLRSLVRTRVGPFRLEDAHTVGEIAEQGVPNVLLGADAALPEAPAYRASATEVAHLTHGRPVPVPPTLKGDPVRVYDASGAQMLFVGSADGALLRSRIALGTSDPFFGVVSQVTTPPGSARHG